MTEVMTAVATGMTEALEDAGVVDEGEAEAEDMMMADTIVTIGTVIEVGVDTRMTMVGAVGVGDVAVGMEADMEEIDTITEAAAAEVEEEEDTGDLLDLLHHNHLRLIWDTVMAPATQLADTGRHRLLSLPL
jgi:hypothetical protein